MDKAHNNNRTILVTGATGRQGGAAVRNLLKSGFRVLALTRDDTKPAAVRIRESGGEIIKGDLDQPESVEPFFRDLYGVFSVQNPWITGLEKEVEHGKRVIELSVKAGVKHIVYSSAGPGREGTGVPHFDTKLQIEESLKNSGLSYTILRPSGFMELMSDRDFVPPVAVWNITGKVLGMHFPLNWIAVDDIGAAAALIFSDPEAWNKKEISLAGDRKSIAECLDLYSRVYGKSPFRLPVPVWLFKKIQPDLYAMYQWMIRENEPEETVEQTRKLLPGALNVEAWMNMMKVKV